MSLDYALVAARFLHFATLLTLAGAAFYKAAFAPFLDRGGRRLALGAFVSAVAWLALLGQGAQWEFATQTAFGRIWLSRLALLAALLLAQGPRATAVLAALAVASLGLVGHAAMQEGALGAAHRAVRALHLLALAYWLGGLPPFLACLALRERQEARDAMRQWSRIGHYAVFAIALAGALEIALTPSAWPWPPATPYLQLLDMKIITFSVMLALALANRYALTPRLAAWHLAAPALAWSARAEIGLGLVALALVSALALLDPHPN